MRVAFAPCLILGAALIASPALADEEPVATASATAAPVNLFAEHFFSDGSRLHLHSYLVRSLILA